MLKFTCSRRDRVDETGAWGSGAAPVVVVWKEEVTTTIDRSIAGITTSSSDHRGRKLGYWDITRRVVLYYICISSLYAVVPDLLFLFNGPVLFLLLFLFF